MVVAAAGVAVAALADSADLASQAFPSPLAGGGVPSEVHPRAVVVLAHVGAGQAVQDPNCQADLAVDLGPCDLAAAGCMGRLVLLTCDLAKVEAMHEHQGDAVVDQPAMLLLQHEAAAAEHPPVAAAGGAEKRPGCCHFEALGVPGGTVLACLLLRLSVQAGCCCIVPWLPGQQAYPTQVGGRAATAAMLGAAAAGHLAGLESLAAPPSWHDAHWELQASPACWQFCP